MAAKKIKKKTTTKLATSYAVVRPGKLVRLSDPEMKSAMEQTVRKLSSDSGQALKFLQSIGVATPTGRLAKRYGG